jgi:hypothetical protein
MREGDLRKAKTRGKDFFCLAPTVSLYSSFRSLRFPFSKKKKNFERASREQRGKEDAASSLQESNSAVETKKIAPFCHSRSFFLFVVVLSFFFLYRHFRSQYFVREGKRERERKRE